jgi:hypothetical protein
MSKSRRGRLNVVRWATGLGVLAAFPFLASGVAQAAIAGGNPLTTTNRPDLRTVHIINAGTGAEFCFDKAISNSSPQGGTLAGNAGRFRLAGYRYDVAQAAASVGVETTNTNCAVATMAGGDLASYSFGTVTDNAVISNAGGSGAQGNIGDSTANLDSTAHSGTADHTAAPDLQAVLVDLTNNRLNYVFDQPVDSGTVALAPALTDLRFLFYDSNGNPHWGQAIGTSGNIVSVQFATAPSLDPVSAALQAVVIRGTTHTEGQPQGSANTCTPGALPPSGAVCESGGTTETIAPTESVAVPGTSGLTARPTLLSAALVPVEPDRLHVQPADRGRNRERPGRSHVERPGRGSDQRDDHLVQHGASDVLGGQPAELPGVGRQGVGVRLRPADNWLHEHCHRRRSGPVGQPAGRRANEVQRHRRRWCRR